MNERAEAQARILRAIERMSRLQREIAHTVAREHEHTKAAMSIARLLDQLGEVGVGDIAQALRVDMSVASRQVSELVDAGLVERTVDSGDRRARNLRLTEAGRAYVERIRATMLRWSDEIFADWSVAELTAAADVYERLVESTARASGCAGAFTRTARAESPPVAVASG